MTTETIAVPEVHCNHCVMSIEGALKPAAGVQDARVDLQARAVEVTYDPDAITRDAIVGLIEEQGYEVGEAPGGVEPTGTQLPQV